MYYRPTLVMKLLMVMVTWLILCHVTSGLPTTHSYMRNRRHRHHHDDDEVPQSRHIPDSVDTSQTRVDTPPPFVSNPGVPYVSDRVVFSEQAPSRAPWFTDEPSAVAELLFRADEQQNQTEDSSSEPRRRTRRSVSAAEGYISLPSHPALLEPVCASVSEWVQRHEAEDVWGNRVRVLQEIDNGSSRVNQYFYETRCSHASRRDGLPPACAGIDSTVYESVCYETHVWAYAKVMEYSRSGSGWTFVKIRVGCNCGLVLKSAVRHGRHRLHDLAGR